MLIDIRSYSVKFLAYFLASFKTSLAYITSFWIKNIGIFTLIAVQVLLWRAIEKEPTSTINKVQMSSIIVYVTMSRFVSFLLPGLNTVKFISLRVLDGSIIVDLLRPVGLISATFASEFGRGIANLLFHILPSILAASIFLNVNLFNQPFAHYIGFFISFLLAYFMAFYLNYLIGIAALWTGNIWGISELRDALIIIFGGSLVPISLYPNWLKLISSYLPFQSIYYIPLAIYSGLPHSSNPIAIQLFWVIILSLISYTATLTITRKAVLQGG